MSNIMLEPKSKLINCGIIPITNRRIKIMCIILSFCINLKYILFENAWIIFTISKGGIGNKLIIVIEKLK
jgi:hypothetical protein